MLPKKTCRSPKPTTSERVSTEVIRLNMKSLRWALIHCDECPNKNRIIGCKWTCAEGRPCADTGEDGHLQAERRQRPGSPEGGTEQVLPSSPRSSRFLPTPRFQTSRRRNCETIYFWFRALQFMVLHYSSKLTQALLSPEATIRCLPATFGEPPWCTLARK